MKKMLTVMMLLFAMLAAPSVRAADLKVPHVAVFFEIPASDFNRALGFYEAILARKLSVQREKDFSMAFFSENHEVVSGALTFAEGYKPSGDGTVIYLNGGEDLQNILGRVEGAGGRILLPKIQLPDNHGFIAQFTDSEGNRIGLFSQK